MIVNAHQYLSGYHACTKQHEHLPLRKQVAEVFGIGEATNCCMRLKKKVASKTILGLWRRALDVEKEY